MFQRRMIDEGSGPELFRLATTTAFQGAVVQPPAIAVNATYKSKFLGPAVHCEPTSSGELELFQNYMENDCSSYSYSRGSYKECGLNRITITYIAWFKTPLGYHLDSYQMEDERYPPLRVDESNELNITDFYPTRKEFGSSNLIVATKAYSENGEIKFSEDKWEVINCTLHEAMYAMDVTSSANDRGSFSNLMVEVRAPQYFDYYDGDEHNGYYAIMDCLIKLLAGQILDWGGDTVRVEVLADITKTSLMFTRPLLYTARVRDVKENWMIADAIRGDYKVWPEEAFASSHFSRSLTGAIEELSHNLTLSLFSRPAFLKEVGDRVDVAFDHWFNVYAYPQANRQANLIASYSTALGLSLLACIAGCVSIYRNGASYSNLFSTMLRTTRGHIGTFDDVLTAKDKDGVDPLPKYVATAQIELGGQRGMASDGGGLRIELQQRFDVPDEQSSMISRSEGEEAVRSSRSASLS